MKRAGDRSAMTLVRNLQSIGAVLLQMVGLRELESLTSSVSTRRSNQLSYRPI